jgi:prophage regulatory protein
MNRIIREDECRQITGLSRTTRWEMERAGTFPHRRRLSPNTVGWLWSDVKRWVLNRTRGVGRAPLHALAVRVVPHAPAPRRRSRGRGRHRRAR